MRNLEIGRKWEKVNRSIVRLESFKAILDLISSEFMLKLFDFDDHYSISCSISGSVSYAMCHC